MAATYDADSLTDEDVISLWPAKRKESQKANTQTFKGISLTSKLVSPIDDSVNSQNGVFGFTCSCTKKLKTEQAAKMVIMPASKCSMNKYVTKHIVGVKKPKLATNAKQTEWTVTELSVKGVQKSETANKTTQTERPQSAASKRVEHAVKEEAPLVQQNDTPLTNENSSNLSKVKEEDPDSIYNTPDGIPSFVKFDPRTRTFSCLYLPCPFIGDAFKMTYHMVVVHASEYVHCCPVPECNTKLHDKKCMGQHLVNEHNATYYTIWDVIRANRLFHDTYKYLDYVVERKGGIVGKENTLNVGSLHGRRTCEICDWAMNDDSRIEVYKRHMLMHMPLHLCTDCDFITSERRYLESHFERVHRKRE